MIKPILFNTEMVRAILEGRKKVTRRLVKPQQLIGLGCDMCPNNLPVEYIKAKPLLFKPWCDMEDAELINATYKPPYQQGDILYVRETWCCDRQFTHEDTPGQYFYKASADIGFSPNWKPSIHMPKEAARIWLRVTNVRVEKLLDITPEQAIKEGVGDLYYEDIGYSDLDYGNPVDEEYGISKEQFAWLWNSTIKKPDIDRYGWNANPWVWVIEFERCEKPGEERDEENTGCMLWKPNVLF